MSKSKGAYSSPSRRISTTAVFAGLAGFAYNAIFTQTDASEGVLMMKKDVYLQYGVSRNRCTPDLW